MRKHKLLKDRKRYIKLKILSLMVILIGMLNLEGQVVPNISDISYVTTQTQRFLIPEDVDISTLSQYDLLALKQSKIVMRHHLYIDDNNSVQLESTILDDSNFPSAGIKLPSKSIINNDGVFMVKEGKRIKDFDHSEKSGAIFNGLSTKSVESGLIHGLLFQVPEVEKVNDKGENYTSSNGIISMENSFGKMMWNTNTNIIYETEYSDGAEDVGYKKRTDYKKTLCDLFVKSKETEYKEYTLPSGLCIKRIIEVVYSDYSFDCPSVNMD